jgi:uridine kinase
VELFKTGELENPMIISISGTSGAGKTTITQAFCQNNPIFHPLHWDDFDNTMIEPNDWTDWQKRGANFEEFDNPTLFEHIRSLQPQNIMFDFPFGKLHSRFAPVIDVAVFLQVSTDLALTRRLKRGDNNAGIDEEVLKQFREPDIQVLPTCDLVVDGNNSITGIIHSIEDYLASNKRIHSDVAPRRR